MTTELTDFAYWVLRGRAKQAALDVVAAMGYRPSDVPSVEDAIMQACLVDSLRRHPLNMPKILELGVRPRVPIATIQSDIAAACGRRTVMDRYGL